MNMMEHIHDIDRFAHIFPLPSALSLGLSAALCVLSRDLCAAAPCQICEVSLTGQPLKGSCCLSFSNPQATSLHPAFSGSGLRDYQTNINTEEGNLKGECH